MVGPAAGIHVLNASAYWLSQEVQAWVAASVARVGSKPPVPVLRYGFDHTPTPPPNWVGDGHPTDWRGRPGSRSSGVSEFVTSEAELGLKGLEFYLLKDGMGSSWADHGPEDQDFRWLEATPWLNQTRAFGWVPVSHFVQAVRGASNDGVVERMRSAEPLVDPTVVIDADAHSYSYSYSYSYDIDVDDKLPTVAPQAELAVQAGGGSGMGFQMFCRLLNDDAALVNSSGTLYRDVIMLTAGGGGGGGVAISHEAPGISTYGGGGGGGVQLRYFVDAPRRSDELQSDATLETLHSWCADMPDQPNQNSGDSDDSQFVCRASAGRTVFSTWHSFGGGGGCGTTDGEAEAEAWGQERNVICGQRLDDDAVPLGRELSSSASSHASKLHATMRYCLEDLDGSVVVRGGGGGGGGGSKAIHDHGNDDLEPVFQVGYGFNFQVGLAGDGTLDSQWQQEATVTALSNRRSASQGHYDLLGDFMKNASRTCKRDARAAVGPTLGYGNGTDEAYPSATSSSDWGCICPRSRRMVYDYLSAYLTAHNSSSRSPSHSGFDGTLYNLASFLYVHCEQQGGSPSRARDSGSEPLVDDDVTEHDISHVRDAILIGQYGSSRQGSDEDDMNSWEEDGVEGVSSDSHPWTREDDVVPHDAYHDFYNSGDSVLPRPSESVELEHKLERRGREGMLRELCLVSVGCASPHLAGRALVGTGMAATEPGGVDESAGGEWALMRGPLLLHLPLPFLDRFRDRHRGDDPQEGANVLRETAIVCPRLLTDAEGIPSASKSVEARCTEYRQHLNSIFNAQASRGSADVLSAASRPMMNGLPWVVGLAVGALLAFVGGKGLAIARERGRRSRGGSAMATEMTKLTTGHIDVIVTPFPLQKRDGGQGTGRRDSRGYTRIG